MKSFTQEELKAIKEAKIAGFMCFEDNDCEFHCRGWDGKTERCDCGKMKMRWVLYREIDGTMNAYIEGYK